MAELAQPGRGKGHLDKCAGHGKGREAEHKARRLGDRGGEWRGDEFEAQGHRDMNAEPGSLNSACRQPGTTERSRECFISIEN